MVDYIIREALGIHGRAILDFWLNNTLVISSVVVAYGIFVIIASNNLQKLAKVASELLANDDWVDNDLLATLNGKSSDFWVIISKSSQFPFISLPFSLTLRRVTQSNLKKLLARYLIYWARKNRIKK